MKLVPGKLYKLKRKHLFGIQANGTHTLLQIIEKDGILLFIETKKACPPSPYSQSITLNAYFLNSEGEIIYDTVAQGSTPFGSLKTALELVPTEKEKSK
jgi:hypothetical protein